MEEEKSKIVYKATINEFLKDFKDEELIRKLTDRYEEVIGKPNTKLLNSWNSSFPYLCYLLQETNIPGNCGITLEQFIPNTDSRKRIDVMITGKDKKKKNVAIILELKQWSEVKKAQDKVGFIAMDKSKNPSKGERLHPAVQALGYGKFLRRYNDAINTQNIEVYQACYLHNYDKQENDPLFDDVYEKYINNCPIFVRGEREKLSKFIEDKICYGDNCKIIDIIDKSRKSIERLLEIVLPDINKNPESIILLDEQELIYEKVMKIVEDLENDNQKRVLIVKGGVGTGKSILAMKLLVEITRAYNENCKVNYITPIGNQKDTYKYELRQSKDFKVVSKRFKSSGAFINALQNEQDVLIIDESNRLKEKSGYRHNKGENQTREIIRASKFSIFFIDDLQRVTVLDKGSTQEIIDIAKEENAKIEICELSSQFRCNGSASYVSWVEDVLQIRDTANHDGFDSKFDYDIRVVDDPREMRKFIKKKNKRKRGEKEVNASRIVAGYCWESKKDARNDPKVKDIKIPKYKFYMSWNLAKEKWAIAKDSIERAGCIYTCQGFDFEYVGVIIGKDLIYRDGKIKVDYSVKPRSDSALYGVKSMKDKQKAYEIAEEIIKNTYRILLTRGQAGCVIFCEDEPLRDYIRKRLVR